MTDIEELVVRAKPAGISDTKGELEGLNEKLDESADELDETTGRLEGLQRRFSGAMQAIMVGLAVATAGLLSQVPVIGELMSGLGAIVDALALRLDQRLRPALQPITNRLFDVAEALLNADGALGTFIDGVLLASITLGIASGVLVAVAQGAALVASSIATLQGIFGGLVGSITGFIAGSIAAQVALGGLIGLFGVAILETTGFLDAIENLGATLAGRLPGWANDAALALLGAFVGP